MKTPSAKPLKSLMISQFFGAFNDNAWKLMVTFLGIEAARRLFTGDTSGFESIAQTKTSIAFSTLTLPVILFSPLAGWLADRFSKRNLIIALKWLELFIMLSGTLLLALSPSRFDFLIAVLALLGFQAALFSPAKYGILPELVGHEKLTYANAQIELWTFLAIILGTASGGLLLNLFGAGPVFGGLVLVCFSGIGIFSAYKIPQVPPANESSSWWTSFSEAIGIVKSERLLLLGILGSVFFWGIASLLGQNVLVYTKANLNLSNALSGIPLAVCGIGVGVGSLLASRLSGPKIEFGLIPLGTFGIAVSIFLLGFLNPGFWLLLVLTGAFGVSSALMIVPLQSLIQWKAPAERRGAVLSFANIFIFAGMFAGTFLVGFLSRMGLSTHGIFYFSAAASFIAVVVAVALLPESLLRLVLILLTHSLYRIKVLGRNRVPERGGVLLTPNHISFIDALLLMASIDRPIRFLVETSYFENPFLRPFMKAIQAIPISSDAGPRQILRALREAGHLLDQGEVVCIFPEGQLTRTGTLQPFKRGFQKLIRDRKAVIVPVHLDRVWGSIFSRERGRYLTKLPKQIPYPITVAFGEALASGTSLAAVRSAVQEAGTDAWFSRKEKSKPIYFNFLKQVKRHPFKILFCDESGKRVSLLRSLSAAVSLARKLKPIWKDQKNIGILLPPSIGGAIVNISVPLSGRTAVNLNYTAGRAALISMIKQADLKTLITHRDFLKASELSDLSEFSRIIYIEDLLGELSVFEKSLSLLIALLPSQRLIEYFSGQDRRPDPDDLLTIIFSSGSTGEPKGVMLSHFNLDTNTDGISQVLRAQSSDSVLGILPFFHSFGFAILWFSLKEGIPIILHPKPLDVGAIGRLVHRFKISIMLATPTFLQFYMKRCTPAQFGSLRIIMTGAEKLSERLALEFEERFGIKPLEGYGTTECSPAVAASVPDFRASGFFQPGSKRGFVGQPLPGMSLKIIDPETRKDLPPGTPGLLMVRGPNIMQGYLNRPDLTERVIHDGWYETGDIALLDEDGFLKITDRVSRFSKIAGEMIPHGKVEDALHEAAGVKVRTFIVTTISDEQKGESLAVIHTFHDEKISSLLEFMGKTGLPNLFIPKKERFLRVENLPILGTGKIDLKEAKRLAEDHLLK
jgi:acyl-[acyl-carrier-protein]-phospholipid O-acyltransferase/long-chain-fatty-acid--[acyl-carrier-protein] ligase